MHKKPELKVLYQQDNFPIFQNRMYESTEQARSCPKGDIKLVENLTTGLVYNDAFVPELMQYDAHYQNEQGLSSSFHAHLEVVASIVDEYMGRDSIVEVGCGKGYFLEMLLSKGFDVTGFDPTYEGSNERIKKEYFRSELDIRAEGLVLRHVLEHIKDPLEFLSLLKEANSGGGKIYIEVPCFEWVCKHLAWFDIYYEHVNYFRISDFERMFGSISSSGHLFGGQYIYVIADLSTLREPKIDAHDRVDFPERFTARIANECIGEENKIAIWGGASKGVIFALLKERLGQHVDMVIDINPEKQGMYLAATGLQVSSPAQAMAILPEGSTVYVMNSNYFEEIKTMSENKFSYIGVDYE